MSVSEWIQVLVNGVMLGFQLALFAVGLTLVYGIIRIINFAHGELYMLGAYVLLFFGTTLGLNFFLALGLAGVIIGLLGAVLEEVAFRPLRGESKHMPSFVMSCGLLLMLQAVAVFLFGPKDQVARGAVEGVTRIGGVALPAERLLVIGVSAAVILVFWWFVQRTRLGRGMRSVAQDTDAARLMGVSINRTSALAMGVGAALAGVAGALIAPLFVVNPFVGGALTWSGFIVVILGGRSSMTGTILAAFALGMLNSVVTTLSDIIVAQMCAAAVLGLVLVFRPQGLVGHASEIEQT